MFDEGLQNGFIWIGSGSNESEAKAARQLFDQFGGKCKAITEFKEGSESGAFWSSVKGKGDYDSIK